MTEIPLMSPIISDEYLYWADRLAESIKKYVAKESLSEALTEIGRELGGFESRIVRDLMMWQIQQEIAKYGEEEYKRAEGITEEKVASRPVTAASSEEIR